LNEGLGKSGEFFERQTGGFSGGRAFGSVTDTVTLAGKI
jgi:hypothetical protein